ncbi:response regulator [Chondromyces apiculatus]|uniref:Two-component system, regulatory protein n=1 Tax=Chondromyces apiculatus DSM 436 TaxID=1192034 RepID=A0A017T841_9BACT|nr:response regulator [Chondromyces apiculatus]EYF04970.1 two-component system, regulatory protein [Chondromyces apiculatus DSM 436]
MSTSTPHDLALSSGTRPTSGERGSRCPSARAHVLLAEQDNEVLRLLSYALRRDGHAVTEVRSGEELLAYLERAETHRLMFEPPDVIVSGVQLPGVSEGDVLEGLQRVCRSVPIICITAFNDRDLQAKARVLGALAVFRKPFDLDDLRTVVLNLARLPRDLCPTENEEIA